MMAILSTSLICLALLGLSETTKGCFNQTLQLVRLDTATPNRQANFVQYCLNGQWKWLCGGGTWGGRNAAVVCRQLGMEGIGNGGGSCPANSSADGFFRVAGSCLSTENSIEECGGIVTVDSCNCSKNDFRVMDCLPANCADGEIRLVGGSTNREGRVEVCMDGRWGTVCINSQEEIAGAVCSQLGFPSEGATSTSTFFRSGPLIHICTVQDNGGLNCTEITNGSCDHTMDLGVVCKSHQEVVEPVVCKSHQEVVELVINRTIKENCTAPNTTVPTVSMTMSLPAPQRGDTVTALGAAVGLLVALQAVILTVYIVCCCTVQRKQSTKRKPRYLSYKILTKGAVVSLLVALQAVTLTVCIVCCCTCQRKQSKTESHSAWESYSIVD